MPAISDKAPKEAFMKVLEKRSFKDIVVVGNEGCDIKARKDSEDFYYEIKSSSRVEGSFFGSVMLTELSKAVKHKDRYSFVLARVVKDEWKFKEFTVDEFISYCSLTTPIFHYNIKENNWTFSEANRRSTTVMVSDELIGEFWESFLELKRKYS